MHQEPELVVGHCSEVQRWDFDPMLVEVEACLPSQAVYNDGSGQTSPRPSLLEPEQAEGSPSTQPTYDGTSAMIHGMDPAPTAVAASTSVQPTSVGDFFASLKLPLEQPLI